MTAYKLHCYSSYMTSFALGIVRWFELGGSQNDYIINHRAITCGGPLFRLGGDRPSSSYMPIYVLAAAWACTCSDIDDPRKSGHSNIVVADSRLYYDDVYSGHTTKILSSSHCSLLKFQEFLAYSIAGVHEVATPGTVSWCECMGLAYWACILAELAMHASVHIKLYSNCYRTINGWAWKKKT